VASSSSSQKFGDREIGWDRELGLSALVAEHPGVAGLLLFVGQQARVIAAFHFRGPSVLFSEFSGGAAGTLHMGTRRVLRHHSPLKSAPVGRIRWWMGACVVLCKQCRGRRIRFKKTERTGVNVPGLN
jgi:hypothetical protein